MIQDLQKDNGGKTNHSLFPKNKHSCEKLQYNNKQIKYTTISFEVNTSNLGT